MRLFRHWKQGKWYGEFRDHRERVRRMALFHDRKASKIFSNKIEKLIAFRISGEAPDIPLSQWIEHLPPSRKDKFAEIGLLDKTRVAAGRTLLEHLEDYERNLEGKGRAPKHYKLVIYRAKKIIKECKFKYWDDIIPGKVRNYISDLRGNGISEQTANFYLRAIKQFCNWMVQEGKASENRIAYLQGIRVLQRKQRRALTDEELQNLLMVAESGPVTYNVSGPDRAMLYRFAVETGLRVNELKNLKRINFQLDTKPATVTVEASYSKHRREDVLPLRPDTTELLRKYLANKLPMANAFVMPHVTNLSKMIHYDYEMADIPYKDESGRYVDFHALRHTFITNLTRAGVHPKMAQILARHSDINLTMGIYTHSTLEDQAKAVGKLPELSRNKGKEAVGL